MCCYRPPINRENWLRRLALHGTGGRPLVGVGGWRVFLAAVKRVQGSCIVHPAHCGKHPCTPFIAPQLSYNLNSIESAVTTNTIYIYSDGAARVIPAWWLGRAAGGRRPRKEICGGERDTTNNRMEMTAVIRALESIKRPPRSKFTPIRNTCKKASANGYLDGSAATGAPATQTGKKTRICGSNWKA